MILALRNAEFVRYEVSCIQKLYGLSKLSALETAKSFLCKVKMTGVEGCLSSFRS